MNAIAHVACLLIALAWIGSGYLHVINPYQFYESILAYGLLPPMVAVGVAAIVPALQLVLGLSLLALPAYRKPALVLSALLFAGFTAAQGIVYSRGLTISCGCFGSFSTPIGPRSIAIAAAGFVAALFALVRERGNGVKTRAAFTLVELLVVIAILGVLAGIMLSVVQKARATAAKTDCQNRLRQLASALHQYHGTHRTLPPGLSVDTLERKYPFTGWPAMILIYLDQEPLWREIDSAFATDPAPLTFYGHEPHHKILATPVPVFTCPSDRRMPGPHPSAYQGLSAAFISFLGVEGQNPYRKDGVLFRDSIIPFAQISDGLSSTLMIGERPPSSSLRLGWWYRGWGQAQDGSGEMLLGVRTRSESETHCSQEPYPFSPGQFNDPCDAFHFWSPHAGGAHFAFCDGSVRFLRYSADEMMPALASRSGGESVDLP